MPKGNVEYIVIVDNEEEDQLSKELKALSYQLANDFQEMRNLEIVRSDFATLAQILRQEDHAQDMEIREYLFSIAPTRYCFGCALCQRWFSCKESLTRHGTDLLHSNANIQTFVLVVCKLCNSKPFKKTSLFRSHFWSKHPTYTSGELWKTCFDKVQIQQMFHSSPLRLLSQIKTLGNGILLPSESLDLSNEGDVVTIPSQSRKRSPSFEDITTCQSQEVILLDQRPSKRVRNIVSKGSSPEGSITSPSTSHLASDYSKKVTSTCQSSSYVSPSENSNSQFNLFQNHQCSIESEPPCQPKEKVLIAPSQGFSKNGISFTNPYSIKKCHLPMGDLLASNPKEIFSMPKNHLNEGSTEDLKTNSTENPHSSQVASMSQHREISSTDPNYFKENSPDRLVPIHNPFCIKKRSSHSNTSDDSDQKSSTKNGTSLLETSQRCTATSSKSMNSSIDDLVDVNLDDFTSSGNFELKDELASCGKSKEGFWVIPFSQTSKKDSNINDNPGYNQNAFSETQSKECASPKPPIQVDSSLPDDNFIPNTNLFQAQSIPPESNLMVMV